MVINNISQRDISKIQQRTVQQSNESDWFFYRRGVITSTITKKRWSTTLNYPAVVYGRESESFAIADVFEDFKKKHLRAKLTKVGLQLHKDLKIFGGSADALVSCEKLRLLTV